MKMKKFLCFAKFALRAQNFMKRLLFQLVYDQLVMGK